MEVTSSITLKPSPSNHRLFGEFVPLNIFDVAAITLHIPLVYVYHSPLPDNACMVEGIAKALFYFPPLAGRLTTDIHGRPAIHLNDAGARVIETRIHSSLQEKLPLAPSSELGKLYPATEGVKELLQIQINRFTCGGDVIGLTAHHRVADGQSMNAFFSAWARLVRGLEPDPLPNHDRQAIARPRNPPKCEFNHWGVDFEAPTSEGKMSSVAAAVAKETPNIVVRYSAEFLSKLKSKFPSENPTRRYSTFLCLLTRVWKKMTLTRGLPADEMTYVRVAVNGRTRMKRTVPTEYFGNAVLWAYPMMSAQQLLSSSYGEVADTIHAAVSAVDDGYFRSFIDFGAITAADEGAAPLKATTSAECKSLSPHIDADSWLTLQFHELELGGKRPVQMLTHLPIEGVVIFYPAPDEKGAVDCLVTLLPEQVNTFKKIAYDLEEGRKNVSHIKMHSKI